MKTVYIVYNKGLEPRLRKTLLTVIQYFGLSVLRSCKGLDKKIGFFNSVDNKGKLATVEKLKADVSNATSFTLTKGLTLETSPFNFSKVADSPYHFS